MSVHRQKPLWKSRAGTDKGKEKGSLNGSCYYVVGHGESACCAEQV